MATSQNGYPANNRSLIHNPKVPGTNITFPGGIRKGAVTTVMLYVAVQWHRRIEPLGPGCWGYAERAIRGSKTTSNHASGTATDHNAPEHPLAVRGTFTAAQRREMRAIERECEGVVRFGEFYNGRVDGMHAEINASLSKVEQVAARLLRGAPSPPPQMPPVSGGRRVLKLTTPHMRGDDVREYQGVLARWFGLPATFADGDFGPATDKWTRQLQSNGHLVVDGEVGDKTRTLLGMPR